MNFLKTKLLVIALVMFAASSAFATISTNVSVDTTSLNGTAGYLYFQYVPINGVASTATVSGFTTDGTLGAQSLNVVNGAAVTGSLPGTVVFADTNGINDYNHAITFGNTFGFSLLLAAPAYGPPAGGSSTFSLGLFSDEGGTIPLFNTTGTLGSVPGTLFTVNLMNDGTASRTVLASQASVAPVPIPAAAWLLGSGLTGLFGMRRRAKKIG